MFFIFLLMIFPLNCINCLPFNYFLRILFHLLCCHTNPYMHESFVKATFILSQNYTGEQPMEKDMPKYRNPTVGVKSEYRILSVIITSSYYFKSSYKSKYRNFYLVLVYQTLLELTILCLIYPKYNFQFDFRNFMTGNY